MRMAQNMGLPNYMRHTISSMAKIRERFTTETAHSSKANGASGPRLQSAGRQRRRVKKPEDRKKPQREKAQRQESPIAPVTPVGVCNSEQDEPTERATIPSQKRLLGFPPGLSDSRQTECKIDWAVLLRDAILGIVRMMSPRVIQPFRLVNKHWCASVDFGVAEVSISAQCIVAADTIARVLLTLSRKLQNLRSLSLHLEQNIHRLSYLTILTNLTRLDLRGTHVGDLGARHLSRLTKLRALHLCDTKVGDGGVLHLANLTGLTELSLHFSGVGDRAHFLTFRNLKVLGLGNTRISDKGAHHLSSLTRLHELKLWATRIGDSGVRHLAGLTNLTRLSLHSTAVGDEGLRYLSGLSKMKKLDLWKTRVSDSGLCHLSGLTNLEELDLWSTRVGVEGLRHLAKLPLLTKLSLNRAISNEGAHQLSALTNLAVLNFFEPNERQPWAAARSNRV